MSEPTHHLSRDELIALKFTAHRQLARSASKRELQPRQHTQRAALASTVRTLQTKALTHGRELRARRNE